MRFAVPAIALLLLVAACGGGDSPFDLEEPTPTVGSVSQSPIAQATSTPSVGCVATDYTVAAGDTLLAIATEHGITVEAIVDASSLEDPDFLTIGQALKIPCPPAITPTPIGTGDDDAEETSGEPEATEDSGG